SIALLAISLWMRLKLSESPVFREMQQAGELARNPFVESFSYPENKRRIFIALIAVAAGLTVIWYTAMFSALSVLKGSVRMADTVRQAARRPHRSLRGVHAPALRYACAQRRGQAAADLELSVESHGRPRERVAVLAWLVRVLVRLGQAECLSGTDDYRWAAGL